jgi:hypothetical protein
MGRNQQYLIAGLMDRLDPMVESPSMTGMSTMMGGGSAATRDDSVLDDQESTTVILAEPDCGAGDCDDGDHFSEFQLRVAKRFIDLMGGADKARAAIDKVDECEDCLGLVDDDDEVRDDHDSSMIEQISSMLPGAPDLPMELSNLYNPAADGTPR